MTKPNADINNTDTWTLYRSGLCDKCVANCCRMPVEATLDDLVRMEVLDPFELQEPLKRIARKLKQANVIEHYNPSRAIFTLARRPNLDCTFLDPISRRCTIYEKRPEICRGHPQIGPKPGYCAYEEKEWRYTHDL
ncbi:MAG: YkgJ family cysteine cluster protein [Caldilineaceae bacterium]